MSETTHLERILKLLAERGSMTADADYKAYAAKTDEIQREEQAENARSRMAHRAANEAIIKQQTRNLTLGQHDDEKMEEMRKTTKMLERQTAHLDAAEERAAGYLERSIRGAELNEVCEKRAELYEERSVALLGHAEKQNEILERIVAALETLSDETL